MEFEEPRPMDLLLDEKGIVQYFPEENRAEKIPATKGRSLAAFFPGFGQTSEEMSEVYEISLHEEKKETSGDSGVGETEDADEAPWALALEPRSKKLKRLLRRIVLWIDPEQGVPLRIRVDDPGGKDYMETLFTRREVNSGVPEGRWVLEIPPGTRVTTVTGGLPF